MRGRQGKTPPATRCLHCGMSRNPSRPEIHVLPGMGRHRETYQWTTSEMLAGAVKGGVCVFSQRSNLLLDRMPPSSIDAHPQCLQSGYQFKSTACSKMWLEFVKNCGGFCRRSNLLLDCLPMSSVDAPPQCFTIGVSVPQQCSKDQPWASQTVTELLKQHNGTDGYTGSLCNVDAGKNNDTSVDVTGTCRYAPYPLRERITSVRCPSL
jgi:hypothetical protein